jgi:hypothetical protein
VADPGRRGHNAKVVERLLSPAEERVALLVSLVVALGVDLEGALVAEGIDLDRVVDDQVDRDERIDLRRVRAEVVHRVAHGGEVHYGGHAREVLHQHPGGLERDLDARVGLRVPARDRLDVFGGHGASVLEAQDVLEQNLQRVGQPRGVELALQSIEAVDLELAVADRERVAGSEAVAAVFGHALSIALSGTRRC